MDRITQETFLIDVLGYSESDLDNLNDEEITNLINDNEGDYIEYLQN